MKNRRGFTFIELVTAMVVLGALCAIAVPRYHDYKARAYRASMTSDLANVRIAEEAFWADHQAYTTDTTALDYRVTSGVSLGLRSGDVNRGYAAVATHRSLPGEQCATYAGREVIAGVTDGEIVCGPSSSGPQQTSGSTP